MYSPKIFLIILGLFSIFGAMAQPYKKKERNLFNYDDYQDYFQDHDRRRPQGHKKATRPQEACESSGRYLHHQMPSKTVLSEDDAELALMTDMSIYTDDDVAWEHEHGRSGIFHGIPKPQKQRALPAAKKQPQPQKQKLSESHSQSESDLDSQLESQADLDSQTQLDSESQSKSQAKSQSKSESQSKSKWHSLSPISLYSSYHHQRKESKPDVQKNFMDPVDMSINKWNWMEKILRQQAIGI